MRSTRPSPASTDRPISSAASARRWSPTAASSWRPFAPASVCGWERTSAISASLRTRRGIRSDRSGLTLLAGSRGLGEIELEAMRVRQGADDLVSLGIGKADEGRAQLGPAGVLPIVGDERFQRRDHGKRLDRLAQSRDVGLELVGFGPLPVVVDVADGSGADVAS